MAQSEKSHAERLGERILAHANEALIGLTSQIVSVNAANDGGTRLRVRPCTRCVDGSGDVDEGVQTRARKRVVDELAREMPLARCRLLQSMIDGREELEVYVPGEREAWRAARRRAAKGSVARLLWVCTAILVLVATALIAAPYGPASLSRETPSPRP